MPELYAAVVSIVPTRRRRFLWAAWWTAPPARSPFRKPDASGGGARSRAEAQASAERAAGRALVVTDPRWAGAWARVLQGEPPYPAASPGRAARSDEERRAPPRPAREAPRESVWSLLGIEAGAAPAAIKRAYHARALATHPDHGGSAEEFRRVRSAYEDALDRSTRAAPRRRPPRAP